MHYAGKGIMVRLAPKVATSEQGMPMVWHDHECRQHNPPVSGKRRESLGNHPGNPQVDQAGAFWPEAFGDKPRPWSIHAPVFAQVSAMWPLNSLHLHAPAVIAYSERGAKSFPWDWQFLSKLPSKKIRDKHISAPSRNEFSPQAGRSVVARGRLPP